MKYKVEIVDDVLKARIEGHHTIWMYRVPRGKPVEPKPGIYILSDARGYCCYVGETDNCKSRMSAHSSQRVFFWWTHTIYFWDDSSADAFSSTDHRRWYEKYLKESVEGVHPTFTRAVQNKPEPESGPEVLNEVLSLLKVIGFTTSQPISTPSELQTEPTPSTSNSDEPTPHKNHRPPLGSWPTYTALAKALAVKKGNPGAAGGIQQKLTNFWAPSSCRYSKANSATRQFLESCGVVFDAEGFVKSCATVPFPLQ